MARRYKKEEIDETASDAYIRENVIDFISRAEKAGRPWCIYVNESNGIQALPMLSELGVPARFCHIRSTHFERKQSSDALLELPDDMLLSAALGEWILVIDYGARKDRSRAIWQGVPYVSYVLNRLWLEIVPDKVLVFPRSNAKPVPQDVTRVFAEWYGKVGAKQRSKLMPFADIAKERLSGTGGVHVEGTSAATTHDNDKLYYARLKKEYFDALGRTSRR